MNANDVPAARLLAEIWAVKALGHLEFLDARMTEEMLQEIIVTGIMPCYI